MTQNLPTWAIVVLSTITALLAIAPALGILLTTYSRLAGQVMQVWQQTMTQQGVIAKHEEQLNGGMTTRIQTTAQDEIRKAAQSGALAVHVAGRAGTGGGGAGQGDGGTGTPPASGVSTP